MRPQGRLTQGWFANGIEGRHVLLGLIVFFGVMLAANSALVYYALETFSGGDRPDPYRSGLNYNDTIEAAKRQAALGWQGDIAYDDRQGQLTLSVVDKAESPVTGLKLAATVSRAATDREDQAVEFNEVSPGVYGTDIGLAPGLWVISLASREEGADPRYRLKRRLFVADRP
ncbi:MAG TPA: FixH family protein [Methyloceanibacter sp.]|nr:FixH family protein [Methyloceanibacter sp.]